MTRNAGAMAAILLAGAAVWAQESATNIGDRFPDAEEKEQVTTTCSACHTLSRIAANHRDQAKWAQTIKLHEGRGLKLDPEDTKPIVRYLAAYFGPMVNLNTASAEEIADLPGLGRRLADAIVQYRQKHGAFKKVDDVAKVDGFQPELLSKVRNRLSVGTEEREGGEKK
jgi:competence ComEA-like helix-hairpin-helix protein